MVPRLTPPFIPHPGLVHASLHIPVLLPELRLGPPNPDQEGAYMVGPRSELLIQQAGGGAWNLHV